MKPIRHLVGLGGAAGARRSAGLATLAYPGVAPAATRASVSHKSDRVAKPGTGALLLISHETSLNHTERAALIGCGRTRSISPDAG